MVKTLGVLCVAACLPAGLQADFSYDQSTKMTGGAMMGMMRVAGVFSSQAREPMVATVSVKGNKLVHAYKDHSQIIDLDTQTITDIQFQKKTYSVVTFAEMKEAMERAMAKVSENKSGADPEFKVSVKSTGATKQIAGYDAKEMIMTLQMEGTDQKSGQKGGMAVTTNIWLAPKVAGHEEMLAFYKKMSEKLAWAPGSGGGLAAARPDLARGMAEVAKEAAKLEGMQVLQVMRMSPSVDGQPVTAQSGTEGQASSQQQSQPQPKAETPSIRGAIGSLGGFGGFGRKKKQEEPKQETAQASAAPAADASGVLMEMTTETSNFSSASVDASKFAVPAGFKRVENDAVKRSR